MLGGDPTGVLFDWLVAIFFIPYVSHPNDYHSYAHMLVVRFFAKYHGLYSQSIIILEFGSVVQLFYGAYVPHQW